MVCAQSLAYKQDTIHVPFEFRRVERMAEAEASAPTRRTRALRFDGFPGSQVRQ